MKKLVALLLALSLVLALSVQAASAEENAPTVYFTPDISPEGLQRVYDALNWTPAGKLAVKVSTGEPPASNYLRAELIGPLVQSIESRDGLHTLEYAAEIGLGSRTYNLTDLDA